MKRLILCSYGLKPDHITLETIKEGRTCDILFCDCVHLSSWLGGVLPDMLELEDRQGDLSVEEKIAAVMGAFSKHDKVGLMTYGHPNFLCSFAEMLKAKCEEKGIEVRVLPAISSTAELLSMAGVASLSQAGVMMTSAIGLPGLSPAARELHVFVFDFHALADGRYSRAKAVLAAYLKKNYSGSHRIELLECENHHAEDRKIFRISELDQALKHASPMTTVYIPPLETERNRHPGKTIKAKATAPRKRK